MIVSITVATGLNGRVMYCFLEWNGGHHYVWIEDM